MCICSVAPRVGLLLGGALNETEKLEPYFWWWPMMNVLLEG